MELLRAANKKILVSTSARLQKKFIRNLNLEAV